jgi:hypothetical protein
MGRPANSSGLVSLAPLLDRKNRARIRHERIVAGEFHRRTPLRTSYRLARSAHSCAPLRIAACGSSGAIERAIAARMQNAMAANERMGTARVHLSCLLPFVLPRGYPCCADTLRPAVLAPILVHRLCDSQVPAGCSQTARLVRLQDDVVGGRIAAGHAVSGGQSVSGP